MQAVKRFAKFTLTGLALAVLVEAVGWSELFGAVSATTWGLLVAIYLLAAIARALEAWQMSLLLSRTGARVNWRRVLLANSLSALYSFVVPGDVAASGAKWANLSAATGEKYLVLSAIIYNRLALLGPALTLGAVAVVIEGPFSQVSVGFATAGVLVVTLGAILLLWHPGLARCRLAVGSWAGRSRRLQIGGKIQLVLASGERIRRMRLSSHAAVLAIGIAAVGVAVVAHLVAYRAVGLDLQLITVIWLHAAVVAARQFPITIGGLGIREGMLVALLAPYGASSGAATAAGLLIFTTSVVFAFVGAGYQVALSAGFAPWSLTDRP